MATPPSMLPIVKRGAVTLILDPLQLCWNGRPIALSPIEAALLAALVRRSRLRWHQADALLADHGCRPESRDVLIHRIRRKFAAAGARDPIETLRGWGIRFRTERDRAGSATFWIGATADRSFLTI